MQRRADPGVDVVDRRIAALVDDVVYEAVEEQPGALTLTYLSERWVELLGDVPGVGDVAEPLLARVHPDDLEAVTAADRVLLAGASIELRYRLRSADGAVVDVLDRASGRRGPDGRIQVTGVLVDLAARESRGDLREAAEILSHIAAVSDDHLYSGELHADGAYRSRFVGPHLDRLLGGMPADGEADLAWERAVHPDDRPVFDGIKADLLAGLPAEGTYRMLGLDGVTRWVRQRAWPRVGRLPDGGVVADGVVTDVSDRVRSERLLRESDAVRLLHAEEEAALRRIATAVARTTASTQTFAAIAREVASLFGCASAVVTRFEDGEHSLPVGWSGPVPPVSRFPLASDSSLVGNVWRTGLPARIEDFENLGDDVARAIATHGFRCGIAAPIIVAGEAWGAVAALATALGSFPPRDEVRLARFADLAALAVDTAESRARLASLAATDPLTGLANHRAFRERLAAEHKAARASGTVLALVAIDLDGFKRVNDQHGHPAGDAVLAEVGAALKRAARRHELIARVGGDEFSWLLPGATAEQGREAAERARAAVAEVAGAHGITASAGICDSTRARTAGELVRLADGALYWAKGHGRDNAVVYDPDVVLALSADERAALLERRQTIASIRALARAIDAKDPSTNRHSERVSMLAAVIASDLGWDELEADRLREAALVHDVGKIGVPDAILCKPGPLTPEEYEQVKAHAALGARIVAEALREEQVRWVRCHHERWDGHGYPDGLTGIEIPPGARVLAVADAFEVMTGGRLYRAPLDARAAADEIESLAGRQFGPREAAALVRLARSGELEP